MAVDEYTIRGARGDGELRQILELQSVNLPGAIDAEEARREGFVTLRHDLGLLREMGRRWAHVVATPSGSERVVGYALVMERAFADRFPVLGPMFEELEGLCARGGALGGRRWYVMGQVCVARAHRGRGLVTRLYEGHRELLGGDFDVMVTEIDRANTRSIRAHEKAGCSVIHEYRSRDGRGWVIVAMELRPTR